jgi:hypothetical protein
MRVPTCQLQHGFGTDAAGTVPYPAQLIELQTDAEAFYGRRGVSILATCTPYQVGNIPVRGEHCAWMESSAVIYANSVLGARTNCEGTASTGAASLTGKIPCWGNHLDGGRHGTHLIHPTTRVESFADWGMLGYFAGGVAGERHPVITGDLARPGLVELKHFGAAAATSGGVELYHIPGITPEARPTIVLIRGSLAPDGGIVKLAVADDRRLDFTGPALVYDSPDEALAAVAAGAIRGGEVVVLREQGPTGSPGMGMASRLVFALDGAGLTGSVAVVTDGQLSGLVNKGIVVGEVSPEAAVGGPLALVRDGDQIAIDVAARQVNLDVAGAELRRRRAGLAAPPPSPERGWLSIYRRLVTPLPQGAVLRETGAPDRAGGTHAG